MGLHATGLRGQMNGFPFVRNYTSQEYCASSANYAVLQDLRGVIYIGNYRGILEYDGAHWHTIVLDGMASVRSLARDSLGTVYAGATGDFGRLVPDSLGRMRFASFRPLLPPELQHLSRQIVAYGDRAGAWFWVEEHSLLLRWEHNTLSAHRLPANLGRLHISFEAGMCLIFSEKEGLYRFHEQRLEAVEGGEALRGHLVLDAVRMGADQWLIYAYRKGLCRVSFQDGAMRLESFPTSVASRIEKGLFSRLVALTQGRVLVATVKEGAFVLEGDGTPACQLDEAAGLQDNLVLGAAQDRNGSLWLALSNGISYVELDAPLRHWGESAGLRGLVFAALRHRGTLYATTPLGVFRLHDNRFHLLPGLEAEAWQLLEVPHDGGSRVWVATVQGLFEVSEYRVSPLIPGRQFMQLAAALDHQGLVYALDEGGSLSLIEQVRRRWQIRPVAAVGQLRFKQMSAGSDGGLWLLDEQQVVHRLVVGLGGYTQMVSYADALPPVDALFPLRNALVLATQQGPYQFQRETGLFQPHEQLAVPWARSRAGIARMAEDDSGHVWVERFWRERHWLEQWRRLPDGQYRSDSLHLSGLSHPELWGNLYPESDGTIWMGTPEGLYGYQSTYRRKPTVPPPPLVRKVVLAGGQLLFHGAFPADSTMPGHTSLSAQPTSFIPLLHHHQNAITFFYAAPYFDGEESTQYSYRLVGHDDEAAWSAWTTERKKDFTLLPPGTYVFEVKARNGFGEESEASSFQFTIDPPWYRRTWAFVGYGLLVILLVYVTVKLNTQRLNLRNENLERMVFERTAEIWEQHKEIVKKTVALKRQKEEVAAQHRLVEQKNEELEEALRKLKAAQSQLVNAEKMASLGQLTAGIAHEINNPINFVKGNINPLRRDFEEIRSLFQRLCALEDAPDAARATKELLVYAREIDAEYLFEEMAQLLGGIEEGATRTKTIVEGLKTFSRTEVDTFKHLDVHMGLDSTLTLLNNKLKDRIVVHRDYADLPVIECLPGKLNQVFMNIIVNAIQAIETRAHDHAQQGDRHPASQGTIGELFIRTEQAQDCLPGHADCIRIHIRDTGMGMSEEVKARIFEPFFTTKDVGQGTGLGLAITFGIIERHHGRIEVHSEPGVGTEFVLILPMRQAEVQLPDAGVTVTTSLTNQTNPA
ncbi:MAG: hypothetical protein OHK0039_08760 [Bacteroidia bacterium]